jgi:aryl-alcohol dehydrogenase-like predicted oxidoreductase
MIRNRRDRPSLFEIQSSTFIWIAVLTAEEWLNSYHFCAFESLSLRVKLHNMQMKQLQIPQRRYRDDVRLSIIGLGGMLLVGMKQADADRIVMEALDCGVNYFDVSPFYGDGEAEEKLGLALRSHRKEIFLSCKTLQRTAQGASRELTQSLRQLHSDYLDLYQFHAISSLQDVKEIFAPQGAMEAFLQAKKEGKIRYIGFSAHSVDGAMAMMERYPFDSILFPVNFISYAQGSFGPQVLAKAEEQGIACLAIKAMAHGPWRKNEERNYPNCWYRPIDDRDLARKALRFTLSEKIIAAIPPGDERLFRLALELAPELTPMTPEERQELLHSAQGLRPLMKY